MSHHFHPTETVILHRITIVFCRIPHVFPLPATVLHFQDKEGSDGEAGTRPEKTRCLITFYNGAVVRFSRKSIMSQIRFVWLNYCVY